MLYNHEENAAERALRKELTRRGLDFRQGEILAGREIDFLLPRYHLAIEVDGFFHIASAIRAKDREKERLLSEYGITLLRLSNQDVLTNVRACGDRIADYIATWRSNLRRAGSVAGETPLQAGLRVWIAKTGFGLQSNEPPRRKRV
ncbi:MAG: endonuclease domain-containing protein [Bacteroidota bacterium]